MDIISSGCVACDGVLVAETQTNCSKVDGDYKSDAEGFQELEPNGHEPVNKSLEKAATLPSEDNEPEAALQLLFSGKSDQPALQLVSAMKGSREKLGASPRKLAVSWAPDVYDPIPNSLSHTVKSRQKKSRKDKNSNKSKKNGKKGQKGNSKGGGGGKDKKQFRKTGGRSDKFYEPLDACDDPELGEFDVGSPDYCGSSFLKKSPTMFHYPVAEAL